MAISFQFNASEYEERSFQLIPEGNHRIRISDVVEKTYSTGKEGLAMTFDVSGYSSKIFFNLVFDPNNSKLTNQKIGEFMKSFGITNPDLNAYPKWVGMVGACRVKHREYNGEKRADVHYFIDRGRQSSLPAWREPAGGQIQQTQAAPSPMYQAAPQYQPGYTAPAPVPQTPASNVGWQSTIEEPPFR